MSPSSSKSTARDPSKFLNQPLISSKPTYKSTENSVNAIIVEEGDTDLEYQESQFQSNASLTPGKYDQTNNHHHHHHHHHQHHHHHKVEKLKRTSHVFKPFKVRQTFSKDAEGKLINSSDADHRAASYLELFYDLIMAATFAKLGDALGEALAEQKDQGGETIYNILVFYFFSFYAIYGCWLSVTTFLNRFQSDGAYDNILILLNIICIGCCNLFLDDSFFNKEIISGFAIFLICAQMTTFFSYFFVVLQHKDFEKKHGDERILEEKAYYFARNYTVDRLVSILWLIPIFFIPAEKYWYVNIVCLFLHSFQYNIMVVLVFTGLIKCFTSKFGLVPVNPKLVQERQGLIFIVALGEIVITSTLSNIENDEAFTAMLFSVGNVALGASMAMTFCLMYFTLYDWPGEESCTVVIRHSAKLAMLWLTLNFILCMCVTLTGCVLKRSTSGSYTESDTILLASSISVFIATLSLSDKLHVFPKIVEYGWVADIIAILLINIWAYACQPYIPIVNGQNTDEDDDEENIFLGAAPSLCIYLLILFILAVFRRKILPVYLTKAGEASKGKEDHRHH